MHNELDELVSDFDRKLDGFISKELKKAQTHQEVINKLLQEKFELNETKRVVIDLAIRKIERLSLRA
ncbi:hypothetical protein LOX61_01370 [Latilactobacillus curvatus]|uniref:hypothetical protein n=1 Tax=Latilactobacillus curvatus TaxID=28038 RepID=UPI0020C81F78|nr:hypothetical protein [Latilactobacillus curvatus]MCP8849152.1 hypothetical protein [Latilactobacillus curvatus]